MNLAEQSLVWLLPAAAIAVFMLVAMMRFTVSLLTRPSRRRSQRMGAAELCERLVALSAADGSYRVVKGGHGRLELAWDVVAAAWLERFARVKLTVAYRARMLLDEVRGEVRWFESVRSSSFFLGFDGWHPRWNWSFFYRSGLVNVTWSGLAYGILPGFPPRIGRVQEFHVDTVAVKEEIRTVVKAAGWGFRPTSTALEVSPRFVRGHRRALDLLVPVAWREWPERRVWGVLYPLSFALFFAYLIFIAGSPAMVTPGDVGVLAVVVGSWWGLWGLVTWALLGFPRPWRRGGS